MMGPDDLWFRCFEGLLCGSLPRFFGAQQQTLTDRSVNKGNADTLMATDYPRSDGSFPEEMEQFFRLPLRDDVRRKILWGNSARLYKIGTLGDLTGDISVFVTTPD